MAAGLQALLGGPFVDQLPLVCWECDLVDFDDAPGGCAGRAPDGDDALVGVHVQELGLVIVWRST